MFEPRDKARTATKVGVHCMRWLDRSFVVPEVPHRYRDDRILVGPLDRTGLQSTALEKAILP
jgi:hypothetical protein